MLFLMRAELERAALGHLGEADVQVRLLIIEDNEAIRRLLRRITKELADEVFERADGSQALEAFALCKPDLVLMDIKMPVMDGLAATRQIVSKFPTARVVIVTDYDDEDMRAAAEECGASAYALKSEMLQLEDTIQYLVSLDADHERR